MRAAVLASGSKGNATFVELDGVRLLIDAGISATRIKRALAALGERPEELSGILLTHEHTDHIAGLRTLSKWYGLPIYSRRGTLAALYQMDMVPPELLHPVEAISFGRVRAESFATSHDAAEPSGWALTGSRRLVLATDLGFVSSVVEEAAEGADILILEANHDLEMLKNGRYPWSLKRRIMSNKGHLENREAGKLLARLKKPPQTAILAHLSEENNRPELARREVLAELARAGRELEVMVAGQRETLVKFL